MRPIAELFFLLAAVAAPLGAQDLLGRALELERLGRWAEAAAAFRAVLGQEPAHPVALLGAQRAYAQIGAHDSVLALVARALAADSTSQAAHTIELRVLQAVGSDSAVARALERWVASAPRDEAPYREWARMLLAAGRVAEVRQLVARGRIRLGDPRRLGPEMAQVEAAEGNFTRAAEEWRAVVERSPAYFGAAAFHLQAARPTERDRVLRVLVTEARASPASRRLAADLLVGWNEAVRAWAILRAALPEAAGERATALRRFADRARALEAREAQRSAAEALELLALAQPAPEAARTRIESARAFAAAGDRAAARRVLRTLAEDPASPLGVAASARATLIELLAEEGSPAEAARLLDATRAGLGAGEVARLALATARAFLKVGALDRAEAIVAPDSSLAADEVRGWIALYRGRLESARALLRSPAAFGGDRMRVTDRAATVALLAAVEADSLPALGGALLLAERGDTLAAGRALIEVARGLGGEGEAETLLWAARFTWAAGDSTGAEALWGEIVARFPASTAAPPALLSLGRAAAGRGDVPGAASQFESLILNYPESALVPEARRELMRVRGQVPSS